MLIATKASPPLFVYYKLIKMFNGITPSIDFWDTSLLTGFQLNFMSLTTTFWAWTGQFYCLQMVLLTFFLVLCQLRRKNLRKVKFHNRYKVVYILVSICMYLFSYSSPKSMSTFCLLFIFNLTYCASSSVQIICKFSKYLLSELSHISLTSNTLGCQNLFRINV